MRFASSIFVALSAMFANAKEMRELPSSVKANSNLGKKLLSQARRLENGNDELDMSFLVDYSLKFQGCHHMSQWNGDADQGEDVRIATKRLIRFRLCPTSSCDGESSGGCDSGYGEYIVDMFTYLDAYLQDLEELQEWTCQNYEMNVCDCDDDDGKDDAFDGEECLNECYEKYGLDYCVEEEKDDDMPEFELEQYIACGQANLGNRRRLEEGVEYFIGPYCSAQGGKVYLGMFTDDSCTLFADDYGGSVTYKDYTGVSLPYSSSSVIGMECVPCQPLGDVEGDDAAAADDAAEVEVKEVCEQLYDTAGKCEQGFYAPQNPNKNACNYMAGIKMVRKDGVVEVSGGSSTASVFIGMFVASTVLLAGYVYYLTTKVSASKINLAE